jgi:3-phosphoshikimate 1-carboxyvinyltransferase
MKTITLPWSKSITNRDFVLAAITSWQTVLDWILLSDDTHHMMNALKSIWINVILEWNKAIIDWWVEKIKWDDKELNVWQSWTCMRFLTAMIILNKIWTITLTGESRLLQRPMWDLFDSLKQLWIKYESNWNLPPIKVYPSEITINKIKMNWTSSSQFFTALLQIAPVLENGLELEVVWDLVSKPYIDLTINELRKFGVKVENENYNKFVVHPSNYIPWKLLVEWDASALSYIACFCALHGWTIKVENIWKNSKQWDYKFLEEMKIFWLTFESDGETTIMKAPWIKNIDLSKYKDYKVDFENMPDASMSFMIMSIFLPWKTLITWLQTLNLKECLRIDAMRDELRKIWVEVESDEKSIIIGEYNWSHNLAQIETYNDHRIAMCFGTLETYIWNLEILNPNCVAKTYPKFWDDLKELRN